VHSDDKKQGQLLCGFLGLCSNVAVVYIIQGQYSLVSHPRRTETPNQISSSMITVVLY